VSAKELVEQAVHELFDRRDAAAVDRYWSPGYIEHSIVGADGLRGLRDLAGSLPEGFRRARTRVIADRDLVVAHGRYEGLGAGPIVAFDVWRVDHDKIVEHWDAHQAWSQAIQTGVWEAVVDKVHRIIAEGEFVFTQGEGLLREEPTAFYDLFRVENDRLAEHWDVVFTKPAELAHGNGLF